MPHILRNHDVEVQIDLPTENYNLSRFDWTGKIVAVKFKGIHVSGIENPDVSEGQFCGQGFYNEFGIDTALGYAETEIGNSFHKIGVGLLTKEGPLYEFHAPYKVTPAEFAYVLGPETLQIKCLSQSVNGYAYELEKEILLVDNGFVISYQLKNRGEKPIVTNEYNHNFLSIDNELIGKAYVLRFPFPLKPAKFGASVNPESIVQLERNEVICTHTPEEQFFFSNLSGGEMVNAKWDLQNLNSKIGISETGNFQTNSINLWGWKHVISPELFFHINIQAGQSIAWTRTYTIFELD